MNYSAFVSGLNRDNIKVNRKMLADIATHEPFSFRALVDQVKFMKGSS